MKVSISITPITYYIIAKDYKKLCPKKKSILYSYKLFLKLFILSILINLLYTIIKKIILNKIICNFVYYKMAIADETECEKQCKFVKELLNRPLKEGDLWLYFIFNEHIIYKYKFNLYVWYKYIK